MIIKTLFSKVIKKPIYRLLLIFIAIGSFISSAGTHQAKDQRPNIILIMSDDMGYSDIGCYGSEINTPHLDALAQHGLRFTQFYNAARCCPTRASLLTGLYPHQAGLGWMTAVGYDLPGYQDELNKHCVTIAEVMKNAGYATYMDGKWHVAKNTREDEPKYNWPLQRGFDKYYGIIKGASNFYDPGTLCRGNHLITPFNDPEYQPENYYFTDAISDNAVRYIRENKKNKPFFMYVAYTAAHWPMQAPEEAIQKYKGKYDAGWEQLRRNRLKKMKEVGVIDSTADLSPLDTHPWSEEKDKKAMARRMETYAAMIDIMDQGIGRIVDELKAKGIYDNTVIFFLEDNGGNAEGIGYGSGPEGATEPVANDTTNLNPLEKNKIQYDINPPITRDGRVVMQGKQVMAGPADTYLAYLKPWAQVSNTPFRKYKHFVHEGGIATPLIVHWPTGIKSKGEISTQISHVIDIMPTIVALGNAEYPSTYKGNQITPMAGTSLVPAFSDKPLPARVIFWEHEMNRSVRMGKWKLVSTGELSDGGYGTWKYYQNGPWELYDMEKDRGELKNLAGQYPEVVHEMANKWQQWAEEVHVFPTPWKEKKQPVRANYMMQ